MIDLTELPDNYFKRRSVLLVDGLEQAADYVCTYVQQNYPQRQLLQACSEFVYLDLADGCRSDADNLFKRLGYFPWVEVEMELGECLNCLILSRLKGALDSLRRSLELAVMAAYFTLKDVAATEAQKWLESHADTPFFSKTVNKLASSPRFCVADSSWNWSGSVRQLYWSLSDYTHCKGRQHAFESLNSGHSCIGGVHTAGVRIEAVRIVLDFYVEVAQHIAAILALHNPVLMFGLPLDEKFGFSGPASGFFTKPQAERLNQVLPSSQRKALLQIAETDAEVQGFCEWVEGMPELSEEELRLQAEEHKEFLTGLSAFPAEVSPLVDSDE